MTYKLKEAKCGCLIYEVEKFKGMLCYDYCCIHCPDAKKNQCQNEQKFGSLFEQLKTINSEEST